MKPQIWTQLPFLFLALFLSSTAWGWNGHQSLMPYILKTSSPDLRQILDRSTSAPCEADDKAILQTLVMQLQLNPKAVIPATASGTCGLNSSITLYQILAGSSVDDPDKGIDRDLPSEESNSFDPSGDRKWMGGLSGPSSQGFRHMYFGGWQLMQPIATFQIPVYPIGRAPQRFEVIIHKAKELIRSGQIAWGTRLAAWAMHYIQDLAQPFHSAQNITWRMTPWYEMWTWPPNRGFESLKKETVRVTLNYHWAYEGYIQSRVMQPETTSFDECLTEPEKYSQFSFDGNQRPIIELAHQMTKHSIQLASDLGDSEMDFFGPSLKQRGVDFTKNTNMINFDDYAVRPDLDEPRQRLNAVSCKALANASLASRIVLEWVFRN